jgi:multiple sugar transport system permease protein
MEHQLTALDSKVVTVTRPTRTRRTWDAERGVLSSYDRRKPSVRVGIALAHVALFIGLVVVGLAPLVLLAKAAITPTADTLSTPLAFFPHGVDWSNLTQAWLQVEVWKYFFNTLAVAFGSLVFGLVVSTTGGYVLSVLKPKWASPLYFAILATLFVPSIVLLVPLYVTVVRPAIGPSLLNNWFGVWLPTAANAFYILLVKRFFDSLPREVFEAARTDGAGNFRLFWSIVLPMSRPILGVIAVFSVIASLKDYLWPYLVLRDASVQTLGVRLPTIAAQTQLGVLLAALAIATVIPIALFLVFQRSFLRGAGLGGAVKG